MTRIHEGFKEIEQEAKAMNRKVYGIIIPLKKALENLNSTNPIQRKYWWLRLSGWNVSYLKRVLKELLERDEGECRYCGMRFDAWPLIIEKVTYGMNPQSGKYSKEWADEEWFDGPFKPYLEIKILEYPVVDHIVPRCQEGANDLDNLVLACGRCNSRKGGRTPSEAGMNLKELDRAFDLAMERENT